MGAINPFFFESPSDRWSFTDREDILPALLRLFGERGRRLLVYGRRRMGKTSLLQNAASKKRCVFVYLDLSHAASLNEVARKLLEAAPAEPKRLLPKVLAIAGKYFKEVGVAAGRIKIQGELRADAGEQTLEQVLQYLDARAEMDDLPWTVCLDEFQEIRAFGGERIDWRIRGIIQAQRNVNYIFSGSDQRLLHWMNEPGAPFFKQLQQMEVGPIAGDHLVGWLERRARTGGQPEFPFAAAIVSNAGPCTGDVIRLAKTAFDLASSGRKASGLVATAMEAIAVVELGGEFTARWHDCSVAQRAMLRALAAGLPPTSADTLRKYGIRSASTAQGAVESLIERGILVRERGSIIFDSPFFRHWVLASS